MEVILSSPLSGSVIREPSFKRLTSQVIFACLDSLTDLGVIARDEVPKQSRQGGEEDKEIASLRLAMTKEDLHSRIMVASVIYTSALPRLYILPPVTETVRN